MPTLNLGRVRFNWKGEYDPDASYLEYDVVKDDGQSYVAIQDVADTDPGPNEAGGGDFWEGVLLRGDDYNDARDEAVQAASDASGSAGAAADSESTASSAATIATDARDKAQQWAEEDEDVEVEAGAYSAKHWAEKAQNFGDPDEFDITADQTSDTRKAREWMAAVLGRLRAASNLSDLESASAARGNLGLGSAATEKVGTGDSELPTVQQIRDIFDIHVPDPLRRSVEAATGGLCTVERTANNQPSFMYVIPKHRWEELVPGEELGTGVHEAFLEDGVEKSELLVGMYMAAESNGELVSQPRRTGRRSIDWDQSVSDAQAAGFELMGNWEWSALSFWCMANGWQPRGNTDYGVSHSDPHERGIYDSDGSGEEYTLLGTGPNAWNHHNAANGIADLVGNRWEWVWGFKMVDGRIFLAPDNDRSLTDSNWQDSGYDLPGDANPWSSLTQSGATQQVQRALIVPNGVADPDGRLYADLSGERFPRRGGNRSTAGGAGLAALHLSIERTTSLANIGLRLSRLV